VMVMPLRRAPGVDRPMSVAESKGGAGQRSSILKAVRSQSGGSSPSEDPDRKVALQPSAPSGDRRSTGPSPASRPRSQSAPDQGEEGPCHDHRQERALEDGRLLSRPCGGGGGPGRRSDRLPPLDRRGRKGTGARHEREGDLGAGAGDRGLRGILRLERDRNGQVRLFGRLQKKKTGG